MTEGASPAPENNIRYIITRQHTRWFYLYCYQCGLQFKTRQCVTIRLDQLTCPGCLKRKFLLWQSGKR